MLSCVSMFIQSLVKRESFNPSFLQRTHAQKVKAQRWGGGTTAPALLSVEQTMGRKISTIPFHGISMPFVQLSFPMSFCFSPFCDPSLLAP